MQISSNQSLSNLSTIESHTSRPKPKNKFSPEEDELLLSLANEYNEKNWKVISSFFDNKSYIQCFSRYKRIRPGIKRGAWSPEEDELIREGVTKFGKSWAKIAKSMKSRNGKQVRDRYINVLELNINKDSFTESEDQSIIKYYAMYGSQWATIAKECGTGRSPDMIKNRYYSHLKNKTAKFIKLKDDLENISTENVFTCDFGINSNTHIDNTDNVSYAHFPLFNIDENKEEEISHLDINDFDDNNSIFLFTELKM